MPPGAQPGSEQVPPQVSASLGPLAPVQSGAPGSFVGRPLQGKARFQRSLCEGSSVRPWRRPGIGRLGVPAAADGRAASGPHHGRRLRIQAEEGGCGEARLPSDLLSTQSGPPAREGLCPFLAPSPPCFFALCTCPGEDDGRLHPHPPEMEASSLLWGVRGSLATSSSQDVLPLLGLWLWLLRAGGSG